MTSLQAYKELGLLMLLVGVAVLTFASLVYFAEKVISLLCWSVCRWECFRITRPAPGPSWTPSGGV